MRRMTSGVVMVGLLLTGVGWAGEAPNLQPRPLPNSASSAGFPEIAFDAEHLARHLHTIDPDVYVLQPGDVLRVGLWGAHNAQIMQMVSAEGEILVPILGELRVGGLTLTQAEAVVQAAVERYYTRTRSGVSLMSLHRSEGR